MTSVKVLKFWKRARFLTSQNKTNIPQHIADLSSVLELSYLFILFLLLLPLNIVAVEYKQDGIASSDKYIDYDYDDSIDPSLEYRKWQEQSMLGKGAKIDEEGPELVNGKHPTSENNQGTVIRTNNIFDIHGYDSNITWISDHQQSGIDISNTLRSHRQDIESPNQFYNQQQETNNEDKSYNEVHEISRPDESGHRYLDLNVDHSLVSTQITVSGKHMEHPDTILPAHHDTNKTPDDTALDKQIPPSRPNTNTIQDSYISENGQEHTKETFYFENQELARTTTIPDETLKLFEDNFVSKSGRNASNSTIWSNTSLEETSELYSEEKPTIYIAGLFPWSEDIPAGAVGRGVIPAVHIALEHINADTRLNRKYTLKMVSNDTRCDMAVATRAFFDMMADSHTATAMLFGDACYNVTGPIVQIAHQWGMFQLSYADTNPMLSNRDQFPNFYRTVPSDSEFNPARLALLRHFNWTTVGTLFQDAKLGEARHGYASNKFDILVEKHKINISIVESFADDPETAIKNLKLQDVRIIVGNFDQNMARKVFCSARQNSMYGPKHQWIILGTYDDDWWQVTDTSITCTPGELNDTIHGYLATDVLPLSTSDDVTESGRTSTQYLELYNAARGKEYSKYHGYAYDGVWVIAKALDRLMEDGSVTTDTFRGPIVGRVLNETSFMGVTGRVQFQNGDRVGSMTILQMQYGKMVKVGEYHALTDILNLTKGEQIKWRDGKPPVDRSIKTEELRHVSYPVYIGFVVMAALGITMAVLFLALNIRYRNHRYIKMSSPNMNNLIIIGCILCYLSIILLGTEPDHEERVFFSYWCTARSWTLALGFTLAFGAMFGKTWRVHAIFTNIKLNKKVIKDYKLLLLVLVLVLLDLVILVTWQIVDPFDKEVKKLSPEIYEDHEIIPNIVYCYSNHMEIWLGTLYVFKGLLLAFGCFLAWETRHVTIPALNDSKYIGMSVYNVVITCVSGAAVSFVIEDKPTQSFIIIGLFIIFCTTITLCLVFLPKIIQLKLNPKGDEQRVRAALRKSSNKSNKPEYSIQKEKFKTTLEENRRLRGFLEQKANELESLLEQLGDDGIKDDISFRSSLLHNRVVELRHIDGSPGKISMKCSATTTLYTTEDSPPTSTLLKDRFHNSKLYSEAIEMAGIRFSSRKYSLTIPPSEEEETDTNPFGGVYLGPSDSLLDHDTSDRDKRLQEAIGERQPLIANSIITSPALYRPGNAASAESLIDNSIRAQDSQSTTEEF